MAQSIKKMYDKNTPENDKTIHFHSYEYIFNKILKLKTTAPCDLDGLYG